MLAEVVSGMVFSIYEVVFIAFWFVTYRKEPHHYPRVPAACKLAFSIYCISGERYFGFTKIKKVWFKD